MASIAMYRQIVATSGMAFAGNDGNDDIQTYLQADGLTVVAYRKKDQRVQCDSHYA